MANPPIASSSNIRYFLVFIFLLFTGRQFIHGQRSKLDSLSHELESAKDDSAGLVILLRISAVYNDESDFGKAMRFARQALSIARKRELKNLEGKALSQLAHIAYTSGNLTRSMDYRRKELEVFTELNNKLRMAIAWNAMGMIEQDRGNDSEALKDYLQSLNLHEQMGNKKGIANTCNNIGVLHDLMGNQKMALEYLRKARDLHSELGNREELTSVYENIANAYSNMSVFDEALKNFNLALKNIEGQDDDEALAALYGDLGSFYDYQDKKEEAYKYYAASLKLQEAMEDKRGMSISYNNLGSFCLRNKKLKEARDYLDKGLKIVLSAGYKDWTMDLYHNLFQLDSAEAKGESAFRNYKLYVAWRDSMNNEEKMKKEVGVMMNYEFEKKESEDRLQQEKKDALVAEEHNKNNMIIFGISAFALLALWFAVFAFRNNKRKNLANLELQKQKSLVDEHQKEIIDSIYYAKRIQTAILPNDKLIKIQMQRLRKN